LADANRPSLLSKNSPILFEAQLFSALHAQSNPVCTLFPPLGFISYHNKTSTHGIYSLGMI